MSNAPRADHWITDWEFSERYPVYTRANAGEVLPDPSSPLNVTMVWNKGLNIGWRQGYVDNLGTHLAEEIDEDGPLLYADLHTRPFPQAPRLSEWARRQSAALADAGSHAGGPALQQRMVTHARSLIEDLTSDPDCDATLLQ